MDNTMNKLIMSVCALIAACIAYAHALYPVLVFNILWELMLYGTLPVGLYSVVHYMHTQAQYDPFIRTRHHGTREGSVVFGHFGTEGEFIPGKRK